MTTPKESRLNIRVSAAQREEIARRAALAGLGVSDYVRQRSLIDTSRPQIIVDTSLLQSLYADQRRIGGLLNQLLRHANMRRQDFPLLARQCEQLLNELGSTTAAIGQLISDIKKSV